MIGAAPMFDPAAMRARFHDLTKQSGEIRKAAEPLRTARDEALASIVSRVKELETEIKRIEAPLFALEQERAMIARALSGKTGTPE